jgi:DNA modification methylase
VFRTIIETSSSDGDFLLDPFCGPGLFLQTAELLERRWVGIADESR